MDWPAEYRSVLTLLRTDQELRAFDRVSELVAMDIPATYRKMALHLQAEIGLRTNRATSDVIWKVLVELHELYEEEPNQTLWELQYARFLMRQDIDSEDVQRTIASWSESEPDRAMRLQAWLLARSGNGNGKAIRTLAADSEHKLSRYFYGVSNLLAGNKQVASESFREMVRTLNNTSQFSSSDSTEQWLILQSVQNLRSKALSVLSTIQNAGTNR